MDYLGECNPHQVPEADFALQFCNRCHQVECTRAKGASFDRRVSTWEETLFLNPPQLSPDDPRYQANLARNFKDLAPAAGVILPGATKKNLPVWQSIEPHQHAPAPKAPAFAAEPAPEPAEVKEGRDLDFAAFDQWADAYPSESKEEVTLPVVPQQATAPQLNTSQRSGIMLRGAPKPEPVYEPPVATSEPVRLLKPGMPIRLGPKG